MPVFKKTCLLVVILCLLVLNNVSAFSNSSPEPRGMHELNKYWHHVEEEIEKSIDHDINLKFPTTENGDFQLPGLKDIFQALIRYFFRELFVHFQLLGKLLLLAVVAALLTNIQKAFESAEIAPVTEVVVFFILLGLALQSFQVALEIGENAIGFMVDFMFAFTPVMLTMLASLGGAATVSIFHPLIFFSVNFFASLVRNIIFPLIFFATILSLIDHFSKRFNVTRLASFLKEVSLWSLGLLLTIFISLAAVQGTMGTVTDAVTLKTAKFLAGTFLPVVGKMLADSFETVAGASLVLKNSIGLAGLFALITIVVFPLLKLLALIVIYRLASALAEPLGNSSLSSALNTMANCLAMVFAAVAAVALVFFIAITILVGAGNMMYMLR